MKHNMMNNKSMKKMKRALRKGKIKGNLLVEMAEDFKDLITNAMSYKKMNKKK